MDTKISSGHTLRELRRKRNMTGEQLAQKVGISQSKISKIETGFSPHLEAKTLEKLLDILDAPQTIRQRLSAELYGGATPQIGGYKTIRAATEVVRSIRQASRVEVFGVATIPYLLHTPEFHEALLSHFSMDKDERQARSTKVLMNLQDLLWDKKRHFHFIMPETALYTTPGSIGIQVAQLDRLHRMVGVSNIRIGVIPFDVGLVPIECSNFVVYNKTSLIVATTGYDIISSDPAELALYLKLFNALDRRADYGTAARALIEKAIDHPKF
ncbi:MAG TPA: helix-turn-helix transcriptional regulator [Candidatus Saccharimonadales bacterium]|nr:helix-turn-helix transcriptional regulator [Candidatus Saccharimonadales bacterium]